MARLPTADDLTQTVAQTAMKTGSYTARPMTGIASGLDKAGAELMAKAEQDRKTAESYESDKAKVDYLRTESELRMKYETDPDYKTAPDRMRAELEDFRVKRMSGLPANAAKDFDLWGQGQVTQAYERSDGERKVKYKAEELGTWKQNSDDLEALAARQKLAGDDAGFAQTMQILNDADDKVAALAPEARMTIAEKRAGGRAVTMGKIIADSLPANKVAGWLRKPDPSVPPQPRAAVSNEAIHAAFHAQESSSGANAKTSIDGAVGDMQIMPDTFKRFALPGENINNPEDNKRVGRRMLDKFMKDYDGDPARVAVAYFSGEGNVAPAGFPTPYLRNTKDGNGKYTADYANDIVKRVGGTPIDTTSTGYYEVDQWRNSDPIGFKNFVEQKAGETNRESVVAKSNFELAIASTKDPVELDSIRQQVDDNGLLDTVKKNELKMKILSQGKEMREKNASIARGAMVFGGSAGFNPKDTDAVKDVNNAYEALLPALKEKSPQERNYILADMVSKIGFVPDLMKGDIMSATRSLKPDVVVAAADLLDRVSASNAHMVEDIGSEKDRSRLRMINDRINAGVDPKEAVAMVDKALSPLNEATVNAVKEELKTLYGKKEASFWRDKAVGQFESIFSRDPVTTGVGVADAVDGMAAKYRQAFEDNYLLTRDVKLADQRAAEVIRGQYGRSSVNGFSQVLQYNPEKYFAIEGKDNDWMRGQMLEAAESIYKGTLNPPPREYLEKNLRLIVDPKLTPRTAATGSPQYRLMLVRDGALVDFSQGKPFTFDVDAEKKKMIEEARAKKAADEPKKESPAKEYKSMDGFETRMNLNFRGK